MLFEIFFQKVKKKRHKNFLSVGDLGNFEIFF